MNYKLPRSNTRVRAVFDLLCKYPNGVLRQELKAAYDDCEPAYNHSWSGPRSHSSMEISKLVKKFCNRTGTPGNYVCKIKPEWAEVALKNPFYCLATTGVDMAKLELVAGGSVRHLGAEIVEGFDHIAGHRVELKLRQDVEDSVPVKKADFKAGDWVLVTSTAAGIDKALKANGIEKGKVYQVKDVENGFVHLSGCTGGWFPSHFTLVTRPPTKVQGSPEIEDMAWQHKFDAAYDAKVAKAVIDIERPVQSHVANAEVQALQMENTALKLRSAVLKDELQTFSSELINAEKNMHEWQDASNEWETRFRELASAAERWKEAVDVAINLTQMLNECTIGNVRDNIEGLEAQLVGITQHIDEAL